MCYNDVKEIAVPISKGFPLLCNVNPDNFEFSC